VLHQVGVGALGPVFRTYDPSQDRLVAVKVFRLDITPEQAQALADELSKTAEAGLFHPSIVEPIAAGMEETVAYRADEYVAAETLDVAMRHYAPAPIEKVLPFITQLAGAIDFARTAGIGHGALHPRDIFVTPEEARAGGFGTVEALERVGIRAPVRRPYTAPERVDGGRWDVTADVFSLGVIAYELLTGRRPSGMGDRIGTITGGPQQAAIHTVLATAVAEDPGRRYPSALAFASALDAAARGETALSRDAVPAGAAAVAAPVAFDDDQLLGADMPPPTGVDEREEPVEAEREEDVFRASEPEFDDIAAERDEDEAHSTLTLSERDHDHDRLAAASERPLFDEAPTEDLDFASEQDMATERFADEFGTVAAEESADEDDETVRAAEAKNRSAASLDTDWAEEPPTVAPVAAYAASHSRLADESEDEDVRSRYDEPVIVPDRRGFGLVPVTLVVALALLVGFAAGYAVRGRAPLAGTAGASTESPADDQAARTSTPQPYSEQAVSPPSREPSPSATQQAASDTAPAREAQSATGSPAPSGGSTPPAAPVATTGRVEVRSTPSNAGVTVNGEWRGRTPLTIDDLGFGSHVVRVVQPGFMTAREEVRLSASSPSRELSFRLQRAAPAETPAPARRPAPARQPERSPAARPPAEPTKYTGSIYVDSRPRGARVLVNGKFMGTTPLRIPDVAIGSQIVRLELANYRFWTTTARVAAGQEARVTGSLEPIR
jgi:hypothetical protein